jgi:hypothetical protein
MFHQRAIIPFGGSNPVPKPNAFLWKYPSMDDEQKDTVNNNSSRPFVSGIVFAVYCWWAYNHGFDWIFSSIELIHWFEGDGFWRLFRGWSALVITGTVGYWIFEYGLESDTLTHMLFGENKLQFGIRVGVVVFNLVFVPLGFWFAIVFVGGWWGIVASIGAIFGMIAILGVILRIVGIVPWRNDQEGL